MGDLTIRVISLVASGRRSTIASELAALQRPWAFFDAIDHIGPAGLIYDPALARRRFGRELSTAELGIFASHFALWTEASSAAAGSVWLILEDDVTFEPCLCALLGDIVHHMGQHEIDFLRLFAMTDGPKAFERRLSSLDIYRYLGNCWGGQAYLLTPAGARQIIATIKRVERPIDNELDRYWVHGLPNRVTCPFPIRHGAVPSTIEPERSIVERDGRASQQWRRWLHYRSRFVMWWHGNRTRIALALGRRN